MAHELSKRADGTFRMAYRYRTDSDQPWHDNQTKCLRWDNDPDLEQVKIDLEANVPIELKPCYDEHGRILEGMQRTWRPRLDINGNPVLDLEGRATATFECFVGPDYTPVQDFECVDWLKPWVDAGTCTVETGGAIFGGSRFWMLAKLTRDPIDIVKDDAIEQYVLVFNGHDGKLAFRAFPTTVRAVCSNTVNLAMQSHLAKRFRAKHRKLVHMKANEIRDEVGEMQGLLIENASRFQKLAAVDVQSEKHLQAYFQQVLAEKVDVDKEVNKESLRPLGSMMRLFDEGIGSDMVGKDTWWMAFNAVTQFVTHMRGRNSDSRLDNMVTGVGASLTDRALKLGLDDAQGNLKLAA